MDITTLFAPIAAIIVLCFVIGEVIKLFPLPTTKIVPVVSMISGGILGAVACHFNVLDLGSMDMITAAAVGIVSGLAATGTFSAIKNITGKYDN